MQVQYQRSERKLLTTKGIVIAHPGPTVPTVYIGNCAKAAMESCHSLITSIVYNPCIGNSEYSGRWQGWALISSIGEDSEKRLRAIGDTVGCVEFGFTSLYVEFSPRCRPFWYPQINTLLPNIHRSSLNAADPKLRSAVLSNASYRESLVAAGRTPLLVWESVFHQLSDHGQRSRNTIAGLNPNQPFSHLLLFDISSTFSSSCLNLNCTVCRFCMERATAEAAIGRQVVMDLTCCSGLVAVEPRCPHYLIG
ncbi:uncharacterized protein MYCFIDRAFT_171096 [Pseudocercospora fijiensis CIRAD86]|uniref:Uncharacterized protein n=1 Tax=Pseudocercospora fijiensis (strain CIRAD86) TaxID=383855 RepID=N1Q9U6_PSEFD|nr:uncharacterized protein MYCFIDRAFT_171096 [Pseudocercospora fijiensis CIRAD86]EME89685.1 hypothetical protein MYCFIDRAFT_171096 [Pseudocercospora fijiensis CIRAD86]